MDDVAIADEVEDAESTAGSAVWLGAGVLTGAGVMIALIVLVAAIQRSEPARAMPAPHFVEESAAAGIAHSYDGEFVFFVGGGVAVLDCNADGLPDLYFAGGANPAALYRNESAVGGSLQFEAVPGPATDLTDVTGAYPIDIDADGLVDLAVLRVGENVILRGTGDCGFERANEAYGIDGGDEWTAAFSATWQDDANLPTLAFGNYVALDANREPADTCADSALFRPAGPDAYAALPLSPGWCTLSILFSDWNRSGVPDLRMTNDRHYYLDGEDQLWDMSEATPRLYTHDDGWQELRIWGMGIASQDITGDGLPEVFLTSQADNKLQTLAEGAVQPRYRDVALVSGAIATRPFTGPDTTLPSTAWHAEFQDVNNDGNLDLYIAKGNVEAQLGYADQDPNDLLLGNPDGTFLEAADTAGIVNFARTRGAALVDLNLDGMLDLVEVDRRESVKLYRNLGWGDDEQPRPMGNWIAVQLEQPGSNRDGIGSWIEVRAGGRSIQREVTIGGGHAGGQLGWIHFGLGEAERAEIRVQWPNGAFGPWLKLDAGQFAIIGRGADEPRQWAPPG
jgi:enediyne biosynthesis protein E4